MRNSFKKIRRIRSSSDKMGFLQIRKAASDQESSVRKIPAAMTVPITPATLGPIAYMIR